MRRRRSPQLSAVRTWGGGAVALEHRPFASPGRQLVHWRMRITRQVCCLGLGQPGALGDVTCCCTSPTHTPLSQRRGPHPNALSLRFVSQCPVSSCLWLSPGDILNAGQSLSPWRIDFSTAECSGVSQEGHQKAVVPPPALSPDQGQEAGALRLLPSSEPLIHLVQ